MKNIKQILFHGLFHSIFFIVLISLFGFLVYKGYATFTTVSSGTPLTADIWNTMVSSIFWGSGSSGIYYNGNVGIGTTSPAKKLDVNGSIISRGTFTLRLDQDTLSYMDIGNLHSGNSAGSIIRLITNKYDNSSTTSTDMVLYKNGLFMISNNNPLGSLSLTLGVGKNISITNSGLVGIGTNSPTAKLHVNGDGLATAWNTSSDLRFKKNIYTITGALEKVNSLRGVNFDWRVGEFNDRNFFTGHQIGFIAQEVEQILPQVISTDSQGFKSVQYSNMIALLVEAIKQQQIEILELKENNNKLENRIETIENK